MTSFRKDDVVDKTVIETSGRVLGKVKDVTFDLGGAVTLFVEGADGKDLQVPLNRVTGISQHVVVKAELGPGISTAGPTACQFCGAALAPGQRICPSCGKAQ
jgi:sporulation protein YlmC with PRC-barrel domain